MYTAIFGQENTNGLGYMLEKTRLVGHIGVTTGQCISKGIKVEAVINFLIERKISNISPNLVIFEGTVATLAKFWRNIRFSTRIKIYVWFQMKNVAKFASFCQILITFGQNLTFKI